MILHVLSWMLVALSWLPSQPHASISKFSVISTRCVNESMSVWRKPHPATSLLDCFVSSRSAGRLHSVGVVQRNRRDASCALFRFGQVCQLLSLINISSTSAGPTADCETVLDSEYNAVQANEHFAAVWVGDRGPMLENLVCGPNGQRNLMRASGVSWTSEGARMDGVTSRLWVNDTEGFDFTNSYTWILHLKRTPGDNCFIELADCTSFNYQDHLWEHSQVPSVTRSMYLNPGRYALFQTGSVLPSNPEQFFIAGVAFERLANSSSFFLGKYFLASNLHVLSSGYMYTGAGACIKIGWRSSDNFGMLQGTIRAVAVANSALTEDAIRRLFQGV